MTPFFPTGEPPAAPDFVVEFVAQIAKIIGLAPSSIPDPVARPMHVALNCANYGQATAVVIEFQGSGPWLTIMASGLHYSRSDHRDIVVQHKLMRDGAKKVAVSRLIDQLLEAIFTQQNKP
jgi:hypothetical protein